MTSPIRRQRKLSGGRAAVSFGSGWNANDFVLFPDRYASRQAIMFEQIETIKRLWQGEAVTRPNGTGRSVDVTITGSCPG